MTNDQTIEARTGPGSVSDGSGEFIRQEKRAAEGLVDDAKAAASEAGSQARRLAADKVDEVQGAAAGHLKNFADAVRKAGDELAEKEPGPMSDLVRQAAEGLERFSGALGRKSSGAMIDGVRDFGRQNPVGFLAGSVLAGFALARFAGSSAPVDGVRSRQTDGNPDSTAEAFDKPDFNDGTYAARRDTTPPQSFDEAQAASDGFAAPDPSPGLAMGQGAEIDPVGEERRRDAMLRETEI